ncbi:probable protein S-acyltransferase 7 [Phoenix dactylifera]|uniref:S-acyltransferase n=1 Tax=Phoenix dactylifera TaxID=42345 RepID=A0A8B8J9Y3_PHODC|nr:probable protein S-acyltransferase 7 [Phoenix dactylifera]
MTLTVIINLVLASTRDPGVVPRNDKSQLEEVGTSIGSRSRRISVSGVEVKVKYCRICKIFRPPRSCHCTVCDNCVEKFDHHCPWISQCIGLRNYRYYLMFIFSDLVFFIYIFAFSSWRIRRKMVNTGSGVFGVIQSAPEIFALAVFSFVSIWFLGGLLVFHAYLITLNQTARENFKQRYAKSPNPYDKGILGNLKEALFTRLPPSKVNFRAVVEPNWGSITRILTNSTDGDDEASIMMQHAFSRKEESPQESSESEHFEEIELK